jgi:hypothetical protein
MHNLRFLATVAVSIEAEGEGPWPHADNVEDLRGARAEKNMNLAVEKLIADLNSEQQTVLRNWCRGDIDFIDRQADEVGS